MKNQYILPVRQAGLIAGSVVLVALAGCMSDDTGSRRGYYSRPTGHLSASVVYQDDYDYYPGYEVYYSRTRREYVYLDGNTWVRRTEPRGITLDVLLSAPSVRMDFRDSPEQHHRTVVKTYPRNWQRPPQKHDDKDERKNDKDKRRNDERKDRKDDNR